MNELKTILEGLDFIDVCHLSTGIYDTDESQAPRIYTGRGRDYKKLNIADTIKGLAWIYEENAISNGGTKTSTIELYVIVNTERSKLTGKHIDNVNVKQEIEAEILKAIDFQQDIDIQSHASEALSRYSNFYETNKQIGKIPYLVWRFDFDFSYEIC